MMFGCGQVSTMRVAEGDIETAIKYAKAQQTKEKKAALAAKKARETAAAAARERERLREEAANEKERALGNKKKPIESDIRFSAEKNVRAQRRDLAGGRAGDSDKEIALKVEQARLQAEREREAEKELERVRKQQEEEAAAAAEDEDEDIDDIKDDPGLEDFKKYVNVEMSAGWIMIPIKETLQRTKAGKGTKLQLDMNGGAPFSLVGIQRVDVPERKGFIEAVKRVVGIKIQSKLELLIVPTVAPAVKKNQPPQISATAILPRDIILPTKTVDIITTYRQIIASETHQPPRQNRAVSLPTGNAVFSSFPRMLNDPAAQRVLLLLWSIKSSSLKVKAAATMSAAIDSRSINPERLEVFNDVVLRVWHAMSCYNEKRSRLEFDESLDSIYARELHLRNLVGIYVKEDGKRAATSQPGAPGTTATAGSTANANATGTGVGAGTGTGFVATGNGGTYNQNSSNANLMSTSNFGIKSLRGKQEGGAGVKADDELPQHDFKPFNVKELLWGLDDGLM